MDKNNKNSILKRKRQKISNKRWTDNEIQQLLEYLQDRPDFEKPTAQIFYRKFLKSAPIDATWDIVRWKVKNLKTTYNKAEVWRKSIGVALLETDGVSTLQDKLRKMCRFYDELNNIFGQKNIEFPFQIYDSATTNNLGLISTPISDKKLQDQVEFCGFESPDDYCLTSVIKHEEPVVKYEEPEAVATEDDFIEASTSFAVSVPLAQTSPLPQESRVEKELQQKNKTIQEFAEELKRAAPKSSLDQLAIIQSERTSFLKLKIEFEKEKFKMEFELNERKFAAEHEEKKKKLELNKLEIEKEERLRILQIEQLEREKRLEIEKEERLRVLEFEKQEREKRLEIEKEERLSILELEKQERIERLEIEMRYKYASHSRE